MMGFRLNTVIIASACIFTMGFSSLDVVVSIIGCWDYWIWRAVLITGFVSFVRECCGHVKDFCEHSLGQGY